MREKTNKKLSGVQVLSRVKSEMEKPRKARSVRVEEKREAKALTRSRRSRLRRGPRTR